MGRLQYSVIGDSETIAWMQWSMHDLHPNTKWWPGTPHSFRKWMKMVLTRLALDLPKLGPGGFRAGGATYYMLLGWSQTRLQELGRWASQRSMSCYLQEAMAALVMSQLDDKQAKELKSIHALGLHAWREPPQVNWQFVYSRARQWRSRTRK